MTFLRILYICSCTYPHADVPPDQKLCLALSTTVLTLAKVLHSSLRIITVIAPSKPTFPMLITFSTMFVRDLMFLSHSLLRYKNHEKFRIIYRQLKPNRNHKVEIIQLLSVLYAMAIVVWETRFGEDWKDDLYKVLGCVFLWVTVTICAQFYEAVQEMEAKYSKLVGLLRSGLYYKAIACHCKLQALARVVSDAYGWQMVCFITGTSATFVESLCTRLSTKLFWNGNEGLRASSLLSALLCLFLMQCVCQRTVDKAEAFNNELFKLMHSNKELCRDNKLFLYVTMRQTVKFTACGFFNLGYPLVTSIIAAATTYLVILLQFSMPSSKQ